MSQLVSDHITQLVQILLELIIGKQRVALVLLHLANGDYTVGEFVALELVEEEFESLNEVGGQVL